MSRESNDPPYSDEEAVEARYWVGRYGPSNSWTAGYGTAARMIGRLLKERERLLAENARLKAKVAFDMGGLPNTIQASIPTAQEAREANG